MGVNYNIRIKVNYCIDLCQGCADMKRVNKKYKFPSLTLIYNLFGIIYEKS